MRVILGNLISAIEADGTIIKSISWDAGTNSLNMDVDPIGEERAIELMKKWYDRDPYSGADLLEDLPKAIESAAIHSPEGTEAV